MNTSGPNWLAVSIGRFGMGRAIASTGAAAVVCAVGAVGLVTALMNPMMQKSLQPLFMCPVCGYPRLKTKPYEKWPPPEGIVLSPPYSNQLGRASYDVCPQCGYEFGFDDDPGTGAPASFDEYRREWESAGRPWFSSREPRPDWLETNVRPDDES
jgi:hypothetical protein